jgi:hypothetical protein
MGDGYVFPFDAMDHIPRNGRCSLLADFAVDVQNRDNRCHEEPLEILVHALLTATKNSTEFGKHSPDGETEPDNEK